MQTLALTAKDERDLAGEIYFGVVFLRVFVEAHEPPTSFLQLFHRAGKVGHTRDG